MPDAPLSQCRILEIDFASVKTIWSEKLWPGRVDLDTHSAMVYLSYDKYDADNFQFPAHFFGLFCGDTLVGCNSVHLCTDESMRSRGLWVDPSVRGKGYGVQLLLASIEKARYYECPFIWSLPRKTSWKTYSDAGFTQTSDWKQTDTSPANAFCRLDIIQAQTGGIATCLINIRIFLEITCNS